MIDIKEKNNTKVRFIELTSDTTFKYLYKNKKTRKWFNDIIKDKFNLDLSDFKLIDNEINTGNKIKDYRMDLVLEKNEIIVIIEINSSYYKFLNNKTYQYLYRTAGSRFETGEEYSTKPTKLVIFNNFNSKKSDKVKSSNYVLREVTTNLIIDDIESFEIYLPNYSNTSYNDSKSDISLSLFSCKSYDEMRKKTNNPEDIKIIEELERLSMNEKFIYEYDREKVRKKIENSIKEEGREEGRKEGESKRNREIVTNMLKAGISINTISKYTDLSTNEIKSLIV